MRASIADMEAAAQLLGHANIRSVAERKLSQLNAAPSLNFMKAPPGNDLKAYDGAWFTVLKRGAPYDTAQRARNSSSVARPHLHAGPLLIHQVEQRGWLSQRY